SSGVATAGRARGAVAARIGARGEPDRATSEPGADRAGADTGHRGSGFDRHAGATISRNTPLRRISVSDAAGRYLGEHRHHFWVVGDRNETLERHGDGRDSGARDTRAHSQVMTAASVARPDPPPARAPARRVL